MAKQFKDKVLYHNAAKERMHKMIIERIKTISYQREWALNEYKTASDEKIKSMLETQNMLYGMELKFLNELLLVR